MERHSYFQRKCAKTPNKHCFLTYGETSKPFLSAKSNFFLCLAKLNMQRNQWGTDIRNDIKLSNCTRCIQCDAHGCVFPLEMQTRQLHLSPGVISL